MDLDRFIYYIAIKTKNAIIILDSCETAGDLPLCSDKENFATTLSRISNRRVYASDSTVFQDGLSVFYHDNQEVDVSFHKPDLLPLSNFTFFHTSGSKDIILDQ